MSYELKPGEKLSHGIRRIAKKQITRIMELEARSGHPAEAVHEARKSLKKARAVVRLVRPILGRRIYRRENRDFRRVARMLSPRRVAEVLLKTVEKLRASGPRAQVKPVLARLEEALKRKRDEVWSQSRADGECESVL